MAIVPRMRPQDPPVTRKQVLEAVPPFSIALDGYVADGPFFVTTPRGPWWNANHHEGVDRLATRATCAQVLVAIRQGLFDTFRDFEGPRAEVFMNDNDPDVALSWFLLKHHWLAQSTINPALNRLVALEDLMDATAGAYPFPKDLPALEELAWVFEPYWRFRVTGGVDRKDPEEFVSILTDTERRIMDHITGRGRTIAVDMGHDVLRRTSQWAIVREHGAQARTAVFADGIRVFAAVRERPNGRRTVSIGKFSTFTPCALDRILAACNAAEEPGPDSWGGGTTIIGSPRIRGTALTDDQLAEIMEETCA
ncbi:hypothetical protein HY480_03075 [Candidatus Uhrbacteria bacterium]|nr:hypothetical protein [Candidatus Uhrbacteria bacterium]